MHARSRGARSRGRTYLGRVNNGRSYHGREDRVPAAPVREHVLELVGADWSKARIARTAGIGVTAVKRLTDAGVVETSRATAERVLAVTAT
jgi:hypothetical protein